MVNVFDVAAAGDSERGLVKQAAQDKLAAAIYDVRDKHGAWLFGATDLDGFNDRAKLAYVSICQTIEPHLHARKGVHRRVLKAMEREWRQRQAAVTEDTISNRIDTSVANSRTGPKDIKTPRMPSQHVHGPVLEGNRHQATEHVPPTMGGWDEARMGYPDHQVDDMTRDDEANIHVPPDLGAMSRGEFLEYRQQREDERRRQHGLEVRHEGNRRLACYPGCHENEAHAKKFHKEKGEKESARRVAYDPDRSWGGDPDFRDIDTNDPKSWGGGHHSNEGVSWRNPETDDTIHYNNPHTRALQDRLRGGESIEGREARRYAEFDESQNHPELNTNVTFQDHQGENLIPKGDWDGYRNRVDQGGPGKIERDFIDGEHVQRHNEDGGHNFVSNLSEYNRIARMLYADAGAAPPIDPNIGSIASDTAPNMSPTATAPTAPITGTSMTPGAGTAPPVTTPMTASREYQIIARMIQGGDETENYFGGTEREPDPSLNPDSWGPSHFRSRDKGHSRNKGYGGFDDGRWDPDLHRPSPQLAPYEGDDEPDPELHPGAYREGSMHYAEAPVPETGGTLQPGAGGIGTPGGPGPVTNVLMPGQQTRSVPGIMPSGGGGPFGAFIGQPGFKGGAKWALEQIREVGTKEARLRLLAAARSLGMVGDREAARVHTLLTKKVADRNYLQQADEAITKVLNEKAEEFQQTIAPLQQALITIQQAEQLSNPLNVNPPAGTVNVLPQQQGGAPQQGAPQGQGGLGADPAAAGLAGQQPVQQVQARRRQAADESYNGWSNHPTWNTALWLGNDEGHYRNGLVPAIHSDNPPAALEHYVRQNPNEHGAFGDLRNPHDLKRVNWREIADSNSDLREASRGRRPLA